MNSEHYERNADAGDSMIRTRGLHKRYGDVIALDGLDLDVPRGTVLGLLGPNGAGKTTCVRILATLLTPDGGTAHVAGVDVVADPNGVRSRLGLSGQYAAVDEYLTGFENLVMVGRLYGFDKKRARRRADELLERFSLSDAAHRPSKTYSGGMRRRLDLAGALVAQPEVLVLDEPTTGLDPRSRLGMWDVIRELVSSGTTLLLTTQYLEEADVLADEIVVIDHGHAIAQGTSNELKSQIGGERVELVVSHSADIDRTRAAMAVITNGDVQIDEVTRTLTAPAIAGAQTLMDVLRGLDAEQIALDDVGLRRPTLDDVFLALTGQNTHTEPPGSDDSTTGAKSGKKRNAKSKEVVS